MILIFIYNTVLLLVRTTGDNIHAQGLQSTNIFRDARSEAEQEIYKRLNAKVDEFLELASYDWTLDESKGHASGYIQDVISFLEGSFKAFKHLPVRHSGASQPFLADWFLKQCINMFL